MAKRLDYFSERDKDGHNLSPGLLDRIKIKQLGNIANYKVFLVDDELVRDEIDTDFVLGGNFSRYQYIPNNEIWISDLLHPSDQAPTIIHEAIEAFMMSQKHYEYDRAHDFANIFENRMRHKIDQGKVQISDEKNGFNTAKEIIMDFFKNQIK